MGGGRGGQCSKPRSKGERPKVFSYLRVGSRAEEFLDNGCLVNVGYISKKMLFVTTNVF